MPVSVNRELCPHNHICPLIKVCPVEAISQAADGYPIVDADKCIECGACIDECPKHAMDFDK